MPPARECFAFCAGTKEDRNLIIVEDGFIKESYKGNHDECNNSLFRTYHLHKQEFPLCIKREKARIVPVKGNISFHSM
jgi:hypothetical protein